MVEPAKTEDWSKFSELLKNPGFEEDVVNNKPVGWRLKGKNIKVVSGVDKVHSGKQAVKLELKPEEKIISFTSTPLDVVAGEKYHIGCWVKGNGTIRLDVVGIEKGKQIPKPSIARWAFKDDWAFCDVEYESDADGQIMMRPVLFPRGKEGAYMYVDDCTILSENIK